MGRKISRPLSGGTSGSRRNVVRRVAGVTVEERKRRPVVPSSAAEVAAVSDGETKTVYDSDGVAQQLCEEIGDGGEGTVWTLNVNGTVLAVKTFDENRLEENENLEKKILKMREIFHEKKKTKKRISKPVDIGRDSKKPGRRVPEPAVAGGTKPGRRILRSAAAGGNDDGAFTADSGAGAARVRAHPYHGVKKFFRYVGVNTLAVLNYLFIKIRQFAGCVVAHAPSAYARFREIAKKISGYIVAIAPSVFSTLQRLYRQIIKIIGFAVYIVFDFLKFVYRKVRKIARYIASVSPAIFRVLKRLFKMTMKVVFYAAVFVVVAACILFLLDWILSL